MSGRARRILRQLLGGLVALAGLAIVGLVAFKSGDLKLVPAIMGGVLMAFGAWLVAPSTLDAFMKDVGEDVRPWIPGGKGAPAPCEHQSPAEAGGEGAPVVGPIAGGEA